MKGFRPLPLTSLDVQLRGGKVSVVDDGDK